MTTLLTLVTCPVEAADSLARTLVEARLAACVNVVPHIASTYRWQGAVEGAEEALLLIKTSAERFEVLRDAILAQHPYELPEILALDVAAGHGPYLQWIADSLAP